MRPLSFAGTSHRAALTLAITPTVIAGRGRTNVRFVGYLVHALSIAIAIHMMIAIATASALALVGAAALASAAHGEPTNVVRLGKRRGCHGVRDVRTVRFLLLLLGVPIGASHNGSQMPVLLLLVL